MEKHSPSGIGVNIEIQLGLLRDVVSELKDALKAGGKTAEGAVKTAVDKIGEMMQHAQGQQGKGGHEDKEAQKVFAEAHDALKEAADMGFEDAKKVLKSFPKSSKSGSK
jgi:hypothetical protein